MQPYEDDNRLEYLRTHFPIGTIVQSVGMATSTAQPIQMGPVIRYLDGALIILDQATSRVVRVPISYARIIKSVAPIKASSALKPKNRRISFGGWRKSRKHSTKRSRRQRVN